MTKNAENLLVVKITFFEKKLQYIYPWASIEKSMLQDKPPALKKNINLVT